MQACLFIEIMKRRKLLKQLLDYNPDTGIFVWKVNRAGTALAGTIAGSISNNGYVYISIYKRNYLAHILAWFFTKGKWPDGEIDHRDTVRHHNWIDNLRDVTHSGNQQNRIKAQSNNTTGFIGVSFCKSRNNYPSQICVNGKRLNLGRFPTPEEAHKVYLEAKKILHIETQ
jgi:hypothetical protein